jgi:rhodanese-related sulfurtransferase
MKTITVKELHKKMKDNDIKVIDVRTPSEHKAVYIENTINIPVENILERKDEIKSEKDVYIHCHSGNRSHMVCEDLALHGVTNLVNVQGGIQEWISENLAVTRTKKWSMPMMQQVMAIAGSLIITGVVGHFFIHPNFVFLSGGVGLGLFYAGLSGNCYMTKVLAIMPWNK